MKLKYICQHGALSCVWIFLIIFGNVNEYNWLNRNNIQCPCDSLHTKQFNSLCCSNSQYSSVYHVLSLLGSVFAFGQLYSFVSPLLYLISLRFFEIAFLFKCYIVRFLFMIPFISSIYIFHYLQYFVFFCDVSREYCNHPPFAYDIVHKLYISSTILLAISFFTQLCSISVFSYIFNRHRLESWNEICKVEDQLSFLREEFHISSQGFYKLRCIKNFVSKWRHMDDNDINEDILVKSQAIMKKLSYPPNPCTVLIEPNSEIYSLLTCQSEYENISLESIQDALYGLFFLRKEFSNAIFTDLFVIKSIFHYISIVLYPAGAIAITRVFGYQNSFGDGIDLFKTYMIAMSFLAANQIRLLHFFGIMINNRPFNIGDVILINDNHFTVKKFDLTHTHLHGPFYSVVPNDSLINSKVANLTKKNVSDSLIVTFPHSANIDSQVYRDYFNEYIALHPRDIARNTVRCGWIENSSSEKVLQCNWEYKFKIFSRSRLLDTKIRISNFILQKQN